jgi:hypothetical protein
MENLTGNDKEQLSETALQRIRPKPIVTRSMAFPEYWSLHRNGCQQFTKTHRSVNCYDRTLIPITNR